MTRHFNSAFSRGVGYEPMAPGLFFDDSTVRGYFIDFRGKTLSRAAESPSGLLPVSLAQLALGWWDRSLEGDPGAMEHFRYLCTLLEESAEIRSDEWRWPYDVGVRKYKIDPPTYSAMAQAQIASAFVRAYLAAANPRHAEIALAAIRPLVNDGDSDLVSMTSAGPVLEESLSSPPSHILNGWIFSLWGLWDVAVGIGDERAEKTYDASLNCLRQMLDKYDIGWWTRYSLYPHLLPDLAKPFYHRLHIDQVEVLYRLTGFDEFGRAARRWRGYDTPMRRMAAIAQKTLFVATG
jgi:heparosan-N-sulfate-glucuronate 5-epimerase